MASGLYRCLANRLGHLFRRAEPASLSRKFVQANAMVAIRGDRLDVALGRGAHNSYLLEAGHASSPTAILWPHNRPLKIDFA